MRKPTKERIESNMPFTETVDHLIPKSRGGSGDPSNKVYADRRCNADKKDLTIDEYRAVLAVRRGLLPDINKMVIFFGEGNLKAHFTHPGRLLEGVTPVGTVRPRDNKPTRDNKPRKNFAYRTKEDWEDEADRAGS